MQRLFGEKLRLEHDFSCVSLPLVVVVWQTRARSTGATTLGHAKASSVIWTCSPINRQLGLSLTPDENIYAELESSSVQLEALRY